MISGVRWLAAARMIAQASNWIITFIVIRLLTPTDYGLQAMVAVIYTLVMLLSQSGYDRAIARHDEFGTIELRQIFGFSLALNTAVMVLIWIGAPLVADYYHEPAVIPLLNVLAVGLVLNVFKTIPIGLVWRKLDYRSHAIAGLVGTVSAGISTLALAILGFGVWALIAGMLVSPVLSAIYLQIATGWMVMPSLSPSRVGSLIKYAFTMSLGFFVWMVATRLDIFIGATQLSAAQIGLYAVAIQLCALPLAKIVPLANEILYPAYARLQDDSVAVTAYFQKSVASLCLILFPGFLGLAAVSEWVVPVILGSQWAGAERVMAIVALAMPFRVVTSMCNPMLQATGNARIMLWTGAFAGVFIAVLILFGLRWGVIGLAAATLAAEPVVMSVVVWQTRDNSGLSLRTLATTIGPSLAISVVMAIIVYQLGRKMSDLMPDVAVLGIQVVAGIIIYFVLAAVFSRQTFFSTLSIIRASLGESHKEIDSMTETQINGQGLASSLLRKWIGRASPGGGQSKLLIIKYHRAESSYGFDPERSTVEEFEAQLVLLRNTFTAITVGEASRHLREGTLPPRAVCITFDDGYADNFHIAMPLLNRHGLRATFFVPSGLLDGSVMWSDQIANVFATAGERIREVREYLADAGMPIRYAELMDKLKYMSVDAQETIVSGLSAFGKTTGELSRLMNAEQIRGLAQAGMEVGGHTVNHTILANVDEERARQEISGCKTQLESIIDAPVLSFAYPNGRRDRDYAERDVRIVREAGFEAAVNTEYGLASRSDELFELPRLSRYFVTKPRLFRVYI
ncbi:MAG: oligosaccharide flippase family protein [Gammaproteobacteria bacterium]|nr:oligosaccharide flippase family protein [Gammaproteobacteria bacterium]